jgi:N-acetylglutamate synthase-like GNAT family acetyltransferase
MLKEFNGAYEIARVTTLPRYQNKGRARVLLQHLVEIARSENKEYVFSVSIEPVMWRFLENLDFCEAAREKLPQAWLAGYDLSRPSKAYKLNL